MQEARHDGSELVASRWLDAHHALDLAQSGELRLPFPTMNHLRMLAEWRSVESIKRWAAGRWQAGISKIRPWLIVEADGDRRFVLPGDPEYPADRA